MQDALATRPGLHRVVVELTEHTPVDDLAALRRQCDELRARGALIALDDAGSGYSGLQQLAALRPQLVKLDRALVSDADTDPVRVALAEMLGEFAGRIDAWLLAEGIETAGRAGRVRPARRPAGPGLAAGPARPRTSRRSPPRRSGWSAPRWPAPGSPTASPACCARSASARSARTQPGVPPAVLVGPQGEPAALLLADPRTAEVYTAPVSLRVHPTDRHRARPCSARSPAPPAQRFDPVLCTDPHRPRARPAARRGPRLRGARPTR